ncbi:uncharacterized protein F4807DRAFT_203791 [Annulohypoxylon truncatum]|uniref:uncharacterized protein n=1 Tax=Annulohypoxylon truncatum TaxID=327061 RepID=UPI00200844F4|nr:uncharacterized protein F4807DRAFT_203791 [Annulohypoxylon truncatum]KAI1213884.1 hypothetical protein F4807DRAFT_203791 [Annulohypoxylon truncatum]
MRVARFAVFLRNWVALLATYMSIRARASSICPHPFFHRHSLSIPPQWCPRMVSPPLRYLGVLGVEKVMTSSSRRCVTWYRPGGVELYAKHIEQIEGSKPSDDFYIRNRA